MKHGTKVEMIKRPSDVSIIWAVLTDTPFPDIGEKCTVKGGLFICKFPQGNTWISLELQEYPGTMIAAHLFRELQSDFEAEDAEFEIVEPQKL